MREIGEFDAAVIDGETIHVPEMYRSELVDLERVHVVLLTPDKIKAQRRDAIQELMENPIFVPDFRAPSRDEMHDGR